MDLGQTENPVPGESEAAAAAAAAAQRNQRRGLKQQVTFFQG